MEVLLAIFLGILYTLLIGIVEYIRLFYYRRKFATLDWFLISLGLFNGIGFSFVIWATFSGNNTEIWSSKILQFDSNLVITYFILNVLLMFSVMFGWGVSKGILWRKTRILYNDLEVKDDSRYYRKIKIVAWVMFVVSVISYILYARAYGGFLGLIHYSRMIRSGIYTVENAFSFLQRFGSFAFFSSFIFFGLLMDKNIKVRRNKLLLISLIVSFLFSIFVLYTWVGRISFIVYLVTPLLGFVLYKNKSILRLSRKLLSISILVLTSIVVIDRVLNRSRAGISMIELFAKELSFPSASFIAQFKVNSFTWFKDIFVAPLFILPTRIWNIMLNIETASMRNTFVFWGAVKGNSGVTGSIPVDLLTFSYMQASVLGVVIIGFLWGLFLMWLQKVVNNIPIKSIRAVLLGNVILNVIMLSVLYGDPLHIITRNIALIIGIIVLKLSFRYKFRWR